MADADLSQFSEDEMRELLGRAKRFEFPYIDTDFEYRALAIEYRGSNPINPDPDQWVISDGFRNVYAPSAKDWVWEPSPSNRDDDLLRDTRMPLAGAVPIITALAEEARVVWDERLKKMIERQEAKKKAAEGR